MVSKREKKGEVEFRKEFLNYVEDFVKIYPAFESVSDVLEIAFHCFDTRYRQLES